MSTIFINTGSGAGGVAASTTTLQVVSDWFAGQNGEMVNFEMFNPNSPAVVQAINLISGNNPINATVCPALPTAAAMIIIPPVGNGATLTIKGINADTGIPIASTGSPSAAPTMISFASVPPTALVINANSTVTGLLLVFV